MTTSETRCTGIEQRCRSGWILRLTIASVLFLSWPAVSTKAATTVTQVAAVFYDSLFLKSDGSVWGLGVFGRNRPTQIITTAVVAIAGGNTQILYLLSNGSLWVRGNAYFGSGMIASNNVTAIASGYNNGHILFIKSDGSLWAMGRNDHGQLGDGTTNSVNTPEQIVSRGVIAAAAGDFHSLFLKSDGSLWAMGANNSGELGDGTYNAVTRPEHILATGVAAIASGTSHSLFIKADGSLWAMGDDGFGQLGDGGLARGPFWSTNRPEQIVSSNVVAIAAGIIHSLFLKSDGSLWAMGYNGYGIYGGLGDGFTDRASLLPEQIIPSPQPVLTIRNSSRTNLQFQATCQFGGTFYLLANTNFTQPLNQWTRVRTNPGTARGSNNFTATLTNAVR